MKKLSTSTIAIVSTLSVEAADLNVTTYNAGANAIFPVSSVLVSGEKEAILFDAQFSISDGQEVVKMINDSNKDLQMIYISAGDPDYYFGLQPILKAFPNVEVFASPSVVEHIQHTKDAKFEYWSPILDSNAPSEIFTPKVLNADTITLEGKELQIRQIGTHQAYVWIPSISTVLGGVSVSSGMHIWTADTQTKAARQEWMNSLKSLKELTPTAVIPGHYLGEQSEGNSAVDFTLAYLEKFEKVLSDSANSEEVINKMKSLYPALPGESDLELSAKVNTGEMEW